MRKGFLLTAAIAVMAGAYSLQRPGTTQVSAATDNAKDDAIVLLSETIQAAGEWNLPQFASWPLREDLNQCDSVAANRKFREFLRVGEANFSKSLHQWPQENESPVAQGGVTFHYDPDTFNRLCGAVTNAAGAPRMRDGVQAIKAWWTSLPAEQRPTQIDNLYSPGMRASAVGWTVLKKPQNATDGVIVSIPILNDDGKPAPKAVKVMISAAILNAPLDCTPPPDPLPSFPSPVENPETVPIESFYWLQLRSQGDRYETGTCGDFLILTNFNLMQKKARDGKQTWLWAAYWWEPDSIKFSVPNGLHGAGPNPAVWDNYAMNATYNPEEPMFNPGRESPGTNCAVCHYHAARIPDGHERLNAAPLPELPNMFLDFILAPAKLETP